MKRVAIIGGGFAGVSALKLLSGQRDRFAVTLIDKKASFEFLPALPDIVGGRIAPEFLTYPLNDLCGKRHAEFIQTEVQAIDLAKRTIDAAQGAYSYDYLLLAAGSRTNFYGNRDLQEYASTLDSVEQAKHIVSQLTEDTYEQFLIGGGGYTGIEIATNIWRFLARRTITKKIIIVERAPSILGPLPDWMKKYVLSNLARLKIEVLTNTTITEISGDTIRLSNGRSFTKTLLIWAAGVKTPDCVFGLNEEKDRQGRIKVDEFLRLNETCFVAGDAASVVYQGVPLRMSVQFALTQGAAAADNIIRAAKGKKLRRYVPGDPGYIVPMANNASCGLAREVPVKGLIGIGLHYFVCIYRSLGFKNRWGIFSNLVKGGVS